MTILMILSSAISLALVSPAIAAPQPSAATVHVRLVGTNGDDLGEPKIEIFESLEDKKNLASLFRHNSASGIPFGIYRLRAHVAGYWSAEREVRVFQSDSWVVMQLEVGMGRTEGGLRTFSLSGEVKAALTKPIWLRLVGVYSNTLIDGKADESGKFVLSGIPPASYVLMTIQDGQVLDVRPIEITAVSQVLITPQSKPQGVAQP